LGEKNPKWLKNDYVKFIRFGHWRINRTGEGILALITDNSYLDNPTFRGMRQSLLNEFNAIYIFNLHGNREKKEQSPDGSVDQNVFDIEQGVSIAIFVKNPSQTSAAIPGPRAPFGQTVQSTDPVQGGSACVYYADLWGDREGKYAALAAQDVDATLWQQLSPGAPWYLFIPQND
jgi:hypothetical protein